VLAHYRGSLTDLVYGYTINVVCVSLVFFVVTIQKRRVIPRKAGFYYFSKLADVMRPLFPILAISIALFAWAMFPACAGALCGSETAQLGNVLHAMAQWELTPGIIFTYASFAAMAFAAFFLLRLWEGRLTPIAFGRRVLVLRIDTAGHFLNPFLRALSDGKIQIQ